MNRTGLVLTANRRFARGFSLIELMVAMALSLLLLGGVIAIFMSTRASYESTDKLSRIQENGRFALDEIARDARSAGYVGCARAPKDVSTSLSNNTGLLWNFLEGPIRGYQFVSANTWSPGIDAAVVTPADGSDVLVLRIPERDATPLRVTVDMASGTDALTVPNTTTAGLNTGDIAMAYSCLGQAYFQVNGFQRRRDLAYCHRQRPGQRHRRHQHSVQGELGSHPGSDGHLLRSPEPCVRGRHCPARRHVTLPPRRRCRSGGTGRRRAADAAAVRRGYERRYGRRQLRRRRAGRRLGVGLQRHGGDAACARSSNTTPIPTSAPISS